MSDDLISRQAAITRIDRIMPSKTDSDYQKGISVGMAMAKIAIKDQLSVQSELRWIPVKIRPMIEEERQYYSELYGYDIEHEEAIMFDCKMPEDGQEIWVCSKCGNVWEDTCCVDEGIGLEGNGDWLDIVAWMPRIKPQPYERSENGVH